MGKSTDNTANSKWPAINQFVYLFHAYHLLTIASPINSMIIGWYQQTLIKYYLSLACHLEVGKSEKDENQMEFHLKILNCDILEGWLGMASTTIRIGHPGLLSIPSSSFGTASLNSDAHIVFCHLLCSQIFLIWFSTKDPTLENTKQVKWEMAQWKMVLVSEYAKKCTWPIWKCIAQAMNSLNRIHLISLHIKHL